MPLWFPPGSGSANIVIGTTGISGGADKQILFNDGGVVQGNTGLTFDKSLGNVSAAGFFIGLSSWLNSNSTSSYLAFGTAQDVRVYRDGSSSILAQRNGTNAQTFRAYNTYTDASNGEWGTFDWATTPNTLTIGTKANGTGAARNINFDVGLSTVISLTPSLMRFAGATASFPALKRSSAALQVRLADDSAFGMLQAKHQTDNAYTAGAPAATGYVTMYDNAGTALRVLVASP